MSRGLPRVAASALVAAGALSCSKVELVPVDAGFAVADATWFAEEDTLFVFYEVNARQGLGEPSVIEVSYTTDTERVDWTPVDELIPVHEHVDVDCGMTSLCGSASVAVFDEPRNVRIRLRYHRDGELALNAPTVFNVIGEGPVWQNRSFLVYGVFDEANELIQWRGRHLFPTLRNEQVQEYGLRRRFRVEGQRAGANTFNTDISRYGYGLACPTSYASTGLPDVETSLRAAFTSERLEPGFGRDAVVCGDATVWDANGAFTTSALARKNPEVRPAFPLLRSPVEDVQRLEFFLRPCERIISSEHEELQRQRLRLDEPELICTDDWETSGFPDRLTNRFEDAITAARPLGRDMVLVVGLHQDDSGIVPILEEALLAVVPEESERSTPRVAGAFVFDSEQHNPDDPDLQATVLWCPAALPGSGQGNPTVASINCAIAASNQDFELGPFSFGSLPILPSRTQYLDFIDTYSQAQAGEITALSIQAPEFSTTSDHVPFGDIGVVTFLDGELFSADADDAFSYCPPDSIDLFAFRTQALSSEEFQALVREACRQSELPQDVCDSAEAGILPVSLLPEWHRTVGENTYELGIFWQFPFLVQMTYEFVAAGSVSAVGLSIPFGFTESGDTFLGTQVWTQEEFPLDELLTQCRRFCDHPTFDNAGVYQVNVPFDPSYATTCYAPSFPVVGDSGFPLDP